MPSSSACKAVDSVLRKPPFRSRLLGKVLFHLLLLMHQFLECLSRYNPLSSRKFLTECSILLFILNIALTLCFLISMNLESNLVSISALTFSVVSSGNGNLDSLNSLISIGMISTPPGALPDSCTLPLTAITDSFLSFLILQRVLVIFSLMEQLPVYTPSLSLRRTKIIPPRSLISWIHPMRTTSSSFMSGLICFE